MSGNESNQFPQIAQNKNVTPLSMLNYSVRLQFFPA
jgi:hypothetical protein